MKRTQRSASPRAIRLISLLLCYALIVTTAFLPLGPSVSGATEGTSSDHVSSSSHFAQAAGILAAPRQLLASLVTFVQGGGPPSVPGTGLPDLNAARGIPSSDPVAPAAIVSDQACTDCTPCPTCGPGSLNHAPAAQAGGPYYGTVGTPIVVNGMGSFDIDPGDGIGAYAWTFGDGTGVVTGATPAHTYTAAGNYTVSLTVTDNHNATAIASTTASITAAPPSVPPSGTTQGNAALFIAQTVPMTMTAGQSYPVSVTMRNIGTTTWSAAHLYRLGSENPLDNSLWGRSRILLPTTVAPGADVTFNFTVIAPYSGADEPPPAQFQWRMVQEFVQWFDTSTPSQSVTIISNYQPNPGGLQYSPFSNLFASRIAVDHRTGQSGEDLLSGNYNWGLGLVDLAGRSGLNLNLGLAYNSMAAWTKVVPAGPSSGKLHATSFTFDADRGFPSAGFRLGFPSIQGPFTNIQTGGSSYLLLMPSGGRVELRRVGATNVYEAANSSYMQLVEGDNGSLLLRTTDGTQLAYWSINSEYRCTEVKDRNGNYLTIKYDPINGATNLGRMTSMIDTLGRTLNFNYDSNYRLQSITQLRNGQTHLWATFGYTDKLIETNFIDPPPPLGGEVGANVETPVVLGLPESQTVSVLTQVGLADGSRYNFDYTSWGQVYKITHHAADSTPGSPHPLSYVSYDLPLDRGSGQTDCPRFTERQDWAENWNANNAVTTSFQIDPNGTSGEVTTAAGSPDQVTYKEFFTTDYDDWRRGLVTRTEISTPNSTTPKKTTTTDWTQDDTSVVYPLNPRPTAITISDVEGNRRRTTIEYTAFGLPSDVYEMGPYGTSDWRTLRRTHTDYNLSAAYVNRRIIGLVSGRYLFAPDASNSYSIQTLMSKATMEYDVGAVCYNNCYILGPQAPTDPVFHHDPTYNSSFTIGRALLSRVKRWDGSQEMDEGKVHTSSLLYNIYGSVIRQVDPEQHATQIHYDDHFSNDGLIDSTSPYMTLAYATMVTDPDGFSSLTKYNYDLGEVTLEQDPKGAAQTTEYDSEGRIKRVTNGVNGAYARYVYPPSQTIVNKFTTIKNLASEAYTATIYDGAGRVRAVAGDFPDSAGNHYSGQFTLYDQQGRAVQSTNPTEMNNAWAAAGADSVGWYSSSQSYDWKGRPLVTTNPDGTTKEANYGGCGCAGGEIVTLTDEGTMDAGVFKRRQQKIYSDALGRTMKTEILNWQGGAPYSTTVNTYNARDQVTLVRQYAGADSSGTYQDTTMTYDGYGRVRTKHTPEQQIDPNNSASSDHTTWDYNADDTVHKVTDARGASQTFDYNARHLVRGISYAAPAGSAMPVPAAVAFHYDPAGNRQWMTDGLGRVDYSYDTLSRLQSETRQFSALTGSYTVGYPVYNLAGSPESITDPSGATINYNYDALGRTTAVTGSSFGGVTQYASNMKYRAWGAVKEMSYGNTNTLTANYNVRLQPTHFEIPGVMAKDYQYQADGRLRYSADLLDNKFDRSYSYDHVGRLKEAFSGPLASGQADTSNRPYKEYSQYDAMDHLVGRLGSGHWNHALPNSGVTDSYVNNRNPNWQYDADGRLTNGADIQSTFDAAGRATTVVSNGGNHTQTFAYDGDGRQSKVVELLTQDDGEGPYTTTTVRYSVYSTVVGKVITELNQTGQKARTFVYNGSQVLAWQQGSGIYGQVSWEYRDPSDASYRMAAASGGTDSERAAEMDPLGSNAGTQNPYTQGHQHWPGEDGTYPGFADLSYQDCQWNGMPFPCEAVNRFIENGAAATNSIFFSGTRWVHRSQEPIVPLGLGIVSVWQPYPDGWRNDARGQVNFYLLPQNPVPFDVAGIRTGLQAALNKPGCRELVESLLNAVQSKKNPLAKGGDIMALFESVVSGKGGFTRTAPPGSAGYGNPLGQISKNNAGIFLFASPKHSASLNLIFDTEGAFHELMHLAGSKRYYSDEQFARAVHDNPAYNSRSPYPPDTPQLSGELKDPGAIGWGGYWNDVLKQKCFESH